MKKRCLNFKLRAGDAFAAASGEQAKGIDRMNTAVFEMDYIINNF